MDITELLSTEVLIGYIAAVCTTAAFIPQAVKSLKYKDTKSLSLSMYIVFSIGVLSWFLYGVIKEDMALILANGITAFLSILILVIKIRNDRTNPDHNL